MEVLIFDVSGLTILVGFLSIDLLFVLHAYIYLSFLTTYLMLLLQFNEQVTYRFTL